MSLLLTTCTITNASIFLFTNNHNVRIIFRPKNAYYGVMTSNIISLLLLMELLSTTIIVYCWKETKSTLLNFRTLTALGGGG